MIVSVTEGNPTLQGIDGCFRESCKPCDRSGTSAFVVQSRGMFGICLGFAGSEFGKWPHGEVTHRHCSGYENLLLRDRGMVSWFMIHNYSWCLISADSTGMICGSSVRCMHRMCRLSSIKNTLPMRTVNLYDAFSCHLRQFAPPDFTLGSRYL